MVKLYHYTHERAALSIGRSRVIKKSTVERRDAFHGEGVYFTSMSPDVSKEEIILNNWDDGVPRIEMYIRQGRVDFVIEVEFSDDDPLLKKVPEKNGRDIWIYFDDVKLNSFRFKIYAV